MHAIMHALVRTPFHYGSRAEMILPWSSGPKIPGRATLDDVAESDVQFAPVDEARQCLLRILSDSTTNGRWLFSCLRRSGRHGVTWISIWMKTTETLFFGISSRPHNYSLD
ncbi:hypothetical protein BR93DRAFT_227213 [Coniochaeta sp. PMI_546]|nr:hypothetical protein BR93DRAFT_227213 [Coniochaeta sp. PMI_546]